MAFVAISAVLVVLSAPAGAQELELTEEDLALVEAFEAELTALADEVGVEGGAPALIGEPGRYDLPPGESVLVGALLAVAPAQGGSFSDDSSLTGPCQGIAISFDEDGEVIDFAADFDDAAPPIDLLESEVSSGSATQAFTASNPFEVHVNGYVLYAGRAQPAPIDHTWEIRTLAVSIDSGGDPNRAAEDRNAGSVNLKDDFPAKISALFRIEGEMNADDGFACAGAGYFKTVGGTPVLGGVGLVLVLAAGAGAIFNARPARTWKG
jgi:hypothetical protein